MCLSLATGDTDLRLGLATTGRCRGDPRVEAGASRSARLRPAQSDRSRPGHRPASPGPSPRRLRVGSADRPRGNWCPGAVPVTRRLARSRRCGHRPAVRNHRLQPERLQCPLCGHPPTGPAASRMVQAVSPRGGDARCGSNHHRAGSLRSQGNLRRPRLSPYSSVVSPAPPSSWHGQWPGLFVDPTRPTSVGPATRSPHPAPPASPRSA